MQKKSWIWLVVFCFSLCMAFGFIHTGKAHAGVQGKFEYEYWEMRYPKGTVEITAYTGDDTEVVVPEVIDGYKVGGIGSEAFKNCKNLKSIHLPSGIKRIERRAFEGCSSLESIKLPSELDYMDYQVFSGCTSLKNVELPAKLTLLRGGTFKGCTSLESIRLPVGITEVTGWEFVGCDSLKSIEVAEENSEYQSIDGVLYSKGAKWLICCPAGKADGFQLSAGTQRIENGAFAPCTNLKSIEIPKGVKANVEYLGFDCCENLTEIRIEAGHPDYKSEDGIVYSKDGSEILCCPAGKTDDIKFLRGVRTIGYDAFVGCKKISSLELPSTITEIGWDAFYGCSGLERISIPSTVTDLNGSSFSNCNNLKEITISEGNPNFVSVDGILYNKDKTVLICYPGGKADEVKILPSVTEIGANAFYGSTRLKNLVLPTGVKVIGERAFEGCENLTNIQLPYGLEKIEISAFASCMGLTSLVFPESLKQMKETICHSCQNLTSIYIPSSIEELDVGIFSYYNRSLKDVYYAGSKEQWEKISKTANLNLPENYDHVTIHFNSVFPGTNPPGPTTPGGNPSQPPGPTTPGGNPSQPSNPSTPGGNPSQPSNPDTPGQVTLTFHAQGGSYVPDITIAKNGSLSYLPLTYRSGYQFLGWYTGPDGTGTVLAIGEAVRTNTTYYAYWAIARNLSGITVTVRGTPYAGSGTASVLAVTAVYADGFSERVYDFNVSQPFLYEGLNTVYVTCRGFTQTVPIVAGATSSTNTSIMSITASYNGGPVPTGFYGSFGGLVVTAHYADGTTQQVEGYTISNGQIQKGVNKVTATYMGKSADFYVTGYQYAPVNMVNVPGMQAIWALEQADLLSALNGFVPSRPGYSFGGWYLDEACSQKVTPGMPIVSGIRVYAKWDTSTNWSLNKTSITLKRGKRARLAVKGLNSSQVRWKTSNSKVAVVTVNGTIKAKKKGAAVITAVTEDGAVLTCKVKVKK